MAINFSAIKSVFKSTLINSSKNAREAETIDAALEIQAEGMAEALKVALETYTAQAVVNGGICVDNGPVSGAVIS